jgi:hypothetical protein
VPLEAAAGGPNFYEFGTDVRYYVYIANSGKSLPDITYMFEFKTTLLNSDTFLYNTGPIRSLTDPNFNRRQTYTVTKTVGKGKAKVIASGLASPPCNIGPHSTPKYSALAQAAVHQLPAGETVFAGQRNDGFFADLGAIFDMEDLRPFQTLHIAPLAPNIGLDTLKSNINVHTIALQIPIRNLTRGGSAPTDPTATAATIGVWGAAARRKMRLRGDHDGQHTESGPWVQVSRLGNPLFNELLVPMIKKDGWNGSQPAGDSAFLDRVEHPEVARLLPDLYPLLFANLRKLVASGAPRKDLVAILLTGLKPGMFSGFQNYTGPVLADMLRLNVAVAPTKDRRDLGLLAGDIGGFPNGRRVTDDVVTITVRMLAAGTYPWVDGSYVPDIALKLATQGVLTPDTGNPGSGARFLPTFPYLGEPHDGFDAPAILELNPLPAISIPGVTP